MSTNQNTTIQCRPEMILTGQATGKTTAIKDFLRRFPIQHATPVPRATMWQTTPPPRDRQIVINGNLTTPIGNGGYDVEPITCLATWDDATRQWLNSYGLSIARDVAAELHIHQWIDLP